MNPPNLTPTYCSVDYICSIDNTQSPRDDLCSISDGSTIGTFNTATGDYSFQSTDVINYPAGIYHFEITVVSGDNSENAYF